MAVVNGIDNDEGQMLKVIDGERQRDATGEKQRRARINTDRRNVVIGKWEYYHNSSGTFLA